MRPNGLISLKSSCVAVTLKWSALGPDLQSIAGKKVACSFSKSSFTANVSSLEASAVVGTLQVQQAESNEKLVESMGGVKARCRSECQVKTASLRGMHSRARRWLMSFPGSEQAPAGTDPLCTWLTPFAWSDFIVRRMIIVQAEEERGSQSAEIAQMMQQRVADEDAPMSGKRARVWHGSCL